MDGRTLTGAGGIILIITLGVIGLSTAVEQYITNPADGASIGAIFAISAIALLFITVLTIIGTRSREWLANPYW